MSVLVAPDHPISLEGEQDRAALARAALARAALARAEERTGTSRWTRPATAAVHPPVTHQPAVHPDALEAALAVPEGLGHLLPGGGLDRGTTVVVAGSTSLVLALVSEASRTGSWVAVVGLPGVGVLAAAELGLDLARVVLVPEPGPDGPLVVAALLDGMDVVVVGPRAVLTDHDRRRLSARARERSSVLVPTLAWPGASVVLTAGASRWEGLSAGHGRLRSHRLEVRRGGRGGASRAWHGEVVLPPGPAVPAPRSEPFTVQRWRAG